MSQDQPRERAVFVPRTRVAAPKPPRRPKRTPEEIKARKAEQTRRHVEARRRASILLADRYPEEFDLLLEDMKVQIADERGALPGDEEQA